MRGKADLQEAALIVMNVKPELAMSGKLLKRTAPAPLSSEKVKVKHGVEEDKSAGRLVIPKFADGTRSEEQGPSSSGKNQKRNDKEGEDHCRSEAPMQQDSDQAGMDDDKASTGWISSLDFNFLKDFETETGTSKERLSQQRTGLPHWNFRQPSWMQTENCRRAALLAIPELLKRNF